MTDHEKFFTALQGFDEGDLGDILAVRNAGLVDTAADRAGEIYAKWIDPLFPKKEEGKPQKAPTSWALYGAVVVGLVGAGAIVWALWPKKAKKSE